MAQQSIKQRLIEALEAEQAQEALYGTAEDQRQWRAMMLRDLRSRGSGCLPRYFLQMAKDRGITNARSPRT